MSNKARRNQRNRKVNTGDNKSVQKAESTSKTVTASLKTEKGQPRLITSSYYVNQQAQKDLQMPKSLYTYDCMAGDDAVATSLDVTLRKVVKSLFMGRFESNGTGESKIVADFLNYCLNNFDYGSWLSFVKDAVTCLQYGFSLQNIVLHKKGYGEYANSFTIKKLAPRDQKTVYAWLFDKDFRELKGFVQKPNKINANTNLPQYLNGGLSFSNSLLNQMNWTYDDYYPVLRRIQYLHFTYNSTNDNPEGNSPLNAAYRSWKEKSLIEQYEVLGITNDTAGLLILRVPPELVEEASDPANNPDSYNEYVNLQSDAAKFHTGESSMLVMTSEMYDGTNRFLYDLERKGIEGTGRQIDTSKIIEQKRKAIYNCFGASYVVLGQDGVGSNALANTSQTVHGSFVEDMLFQCVDVINNQLATRLLAANGIYLGGNNMPKFKYRDPEELDWDTYSKLIQRVGSVNKLTPEMMHFTTKKAFPEMSEEDLESIFDLDFTDKGQSRSADGMKTPGSGTSTEVGGGDSSVSNNENSMEKAFTKVDDYSDQEVYESKEGQIIYVDKPVDGMESSND